MTIALDPVDAIKVDTIALQWIPLLIMMIIHLHQDL